MSRSFAFGISRLNPDLKASVGLGYLICRLLDTVEDAIWPSAKDQEKAFADFNHFVSSTTVDRATIQKWAKTFPSTIPEGERLLLNDAVQVFEDFAHAPESERKAMLNPVLSMSRGMFAYTSRTRETGSLRLTDLTDANVYCFFVAGVVGELLTGLVEDEMRPIGLESVWELATHFGLFLQKINVLKDQAGDEQEGRFLVPSREDMLISLRTNAEGAFNYLCAIPVTRKDYRLFCAWALYLGLATVPLLQAGEESPKIPRLEALALGAKIELSILDNGRLKTMFEDLVKAGWKTQAKVKNARSVAPLEVLRENYVGRLDVKKLSQLLQN